MKILKSDRWQLNIDSDSDVYINRQIYDGLREVIENTNEDNKLPTIQELADQLLVAYDTVAWAYRRLHKEGLVTRKRGMGYEIKQKTN